MRGPETDSTPPCFGPSQDAHNSPRRDEVPPRVAMSIVREYGDEAGPIIDDAASRAADWRNNRVRTYSRAVNYFLDGNGSSPPSRDQLVKYIRGRRGRNRLPRYLAEAAISGVCDREDFDAFMERASKRAQEIRESKLRRGWQAQKHHPLEHPVLPLPDKHPAAPTKKQPPAGGSFGVNRILDPEQVAAMEAMVAQKNADFISTLDTNRLGTWLVDIDRFPSIAEPLELPTLFSLVITGDNQAVFAGETLAFHSGELLILNILMLLRDREVALEDILATGISRQDAISAIDGLRNKLRAPGKRRRSVITTGPTWRAPAFTMSPQVVIIDGRKKPVSWPIFKT